MTPAEFDALDFQVIGEEVRVFRGDWERLRQAVVDHQPRKRDGYALHQLPSPHNQSDGAFLRLLADRSAPLTQHDQPTALMGAIMNYADVERLRTIAQKLDGVQPEQLEEYQLWRDNESGRIASVVFADDKRVVYQKGTGTAYTLGLRRFIRDFTHVPDRTGPARPQPEGRV